jgi:hypothetical protein
MIRSHTLLAAALATILAGCGGGTDAETPGFAVLDAGYTYALPKGFCPASEEWRKVFAPVAAQNRDKAILVQLVDCVDNAKYVNSPNYIVLGTMSDKARVPLTQEGLFRDFKPGVDEGAFRKLLDSGASFADLKRAETETPGRVGEVSPDLFPNSSDGTCLFTGGRYGSDTSDPEASATVINCRASVDGHQIFVMHNGDGKQDLLAMARRVSGLVGSIKRAAE